MEKALQSQKALALDTSFRKIQQDVVARTKILEKTVKVKVQLWMNKLSENTSTVAWKKNRNEYAWLLLQHLQRGQLEEPFTRLPPDGPLPGIEKTYTYPYVKTTRKDGLKKECGAANSKILSVTDGCLTPEPESQGPSTAHATMKELQILLRDFENKTQILKHRLEKLVQSLAEEPKAGEPDGDQLDQAAQPTTCEHLTAQVRELGKKISENIYTLGEKSAFI